jgi:cytochrome c oxidase assembly protein subunit 15
MTRRLPTFTLRQFEIVAWVALATLGLIVLTGAAVRLTGSGLGCSGWPRCSDTSIVAPLETHALIEFGNRLITGVVSVPALLAVFMAWRLRPYRRDLLRLAILLPLGILAQAIIGGITVLTELRAEVVILHFLVSMLLLYWAVLLAWRARPEPEGDPEPAHPKVTLATRVLLAMGTLALVAGTLASAAGPHAGSAGTGEIVARFDFFGVNTLDTLIHWHGRTGTLLGLTALATWWLARRHGASRALRGWLTTVCLLVAAQGVVGFAQYELRLPSELVWLHVVVATGTWMAIVFAFAAAGRLAPARAGEPSQPVRVPA